MGVGGLASLGFFLRGCGWGTGDLVDQEVSYCIESDLSLVCVYAIFLFQSVIMNCVKCGCGCGWLLTLCEFLVWLNTYYFIFSLPFSPFLIEDLL